MSHVPHVMIRSDLVRSRRRELALSARQLETAVGVGGGWLQGLEENRNHKHVTMAELFTLANELGLDPTSVMIGDMTTVELEDDHHDALHNDTLRLGRVLNELDVQVTVSDLAGALEWTQTRLDAALTVLAQRLPSVGLRLARGVHGVRILRDGQVDEAVETLKSERIRTNGLTPVQAAVLSDVVAGNVSEQSAARAVIRGNRGFALATLVNAGIVKPPETRRGSKYTVSDRVRRSLLIETADAPKGITATKE